MYVCVYEIIFCFRSVNIFSNLCVVKSVAPKTGSTPSSDIDDKIESDEYVHDFTDCCKSLNVSSKCLGFCTIHNIIDGTAGVDPDVCEADFPRIVKCMADGRNHLPCCERKKIPDVCQVIEVLIFGYIFVVKLVLLVINFRKWINF